jgi:hypothetical protein
MNKLGWKILISGVLLGSFLLSCRTNRNKEEYLSSWSSKDPLAIPYRIRFQKFEKGNLLRNPSFELGKILEVDTLKRSFSLDGWQKVGDQVKWVDLETDTSGSATEVFKGTHAIKIERSRADEIAERGEGIISGFIRVIPGHYSFSFYTRLLDVRPYSARLGTRMMDAVEIRILFYDKNKILLDSRTLLPFKDQFIDNSFKSLSFANFDHISEFSWGRIIGKSHSFPFSEGDMPDEARHVKFFIGLKGTGTMWIDEVDFRYTDANFTSRELLTGVMDSTWNRQDMILPAPKKMDKLESVILFKNDLRIDQVPRIIIPHKAGKETMKAALLLERKLRATLIKAGADPALCEAVRTESSLDEDDLISSRLIFSLGKNELYNKYSGMLPVKSIAGHEQGYLVYTSNDLPNVIFLTGNSPVGDFYAVATALQLFDKQYPVFYNARILDYPDFQQRFCFMGAWQDYVQLEQQKQTIADLLLYKLNGSYIGVDPLNSPDYYMRSMVSAGMEWKESGLFNTMQFVNTGFHSVYESDLSDSACSLNSTSNLKDAEAGIMKLIKAGNGSYSQGISLAPSFIAPRGPGFSYNTNALLQLSEKFNADKQLLMKIQRYLKTFFPEMILEYCNPWYNNELVDFSLGYAGILLSGLADELDNNVSFLWSGSSYFSLQTDAADISRYSRLIGNSPVLMDNSLISTTEQAGYGGLSPYYPGKLRLYNLFEPFNNNELCYYNNLLNRDRVFINQSVTSEIDKIKLLTALDFYWNTESYNRDLSLWKVLVSLYGQQAARELILFGDSFSSLLEINGRISQGSQAGKQIRLGNHLTTIMDGQLLKITGQLGEKNGLVKELHHRYNSIKAIFETRSQGFKP